MPSPIADVVTGHAVSRCNVMARSFLPASKAQLGLWNDTLPFENMLFAWHSGRSIALDVQKPRRRVRFLLLPH